jgi:hypothetical protein
MDYETSMAGVEGEDAKLEYDQLMRRAEAARKLQAEAMKISSAEEQNRLRLEAKKEMAGLIASLKASKDDGFQPLSQAVDLSEEEAKALSDRLGINVRPGPNSMLFNKKTGMVIPVGAAHVKEKKLERVDAGTHWEVYDSTTGKVVEQIPKNVAGAAAQKELGEAEGKQIAALPNAIRETTKTIRVMDDLLRHKGLPDMLGLTGVAARIPGSSGAAALSYHNQLTGRMFMEAFAALKGAGQITEKEGEKATAAAARLDRNLSPADYKAAVKEVRDELAELLKLSERKWADHLIKQQRAKGRQ